MPVSVSPWGALYDHLCEEGEGAWQVSGPERYYSEPRLSFDAAGSRLRDMLNQCVLHAQKSPLFLRHGAICFKGPKILGEGYNDTRPSPWAWQTLRKNIPENHVHFRNSHAEVSCMRNVGEKALRGADMMVVRIGRPLGQELRFSRPCKYCHALLKKKGIRKVYYSMDSDSFGIMDIRE
jgi:tRNA(Arg) A34 adenosine deaminase TadA